jgi:hypothetical protein
MPNELVYVQSINVGRAERCSRTEAADLYQAVASSSQGLGVLDFRPDAVNAPVFVVGSKGLLCTLLPNSTYTGFLNYHVQEGLQDLNQLIEIMEEEIVECAATGSYGDPRVIIDESRKEDIAMIAKALGLRPRNRGSTRVF